MCPLPVSSRPDGSLSGQLASTMKNITEQGANKKLYETLSIFLYAPLLWKLAKAFFC